MKLILITLHGTLEYIFRIITVKLDRLVRLNKSRLIELSKKITIPTIPLSKN